VVTYHPLKSISFPKMIWNIEDTYLGYILKEEKLENSKVAIFDFLDNIRPSRSLCIPQTWPSMSKSAQKQ
jgi:hypothetical protein